MKLVPTPPRGARAIRSYAADATIADVERDAALVAALNRVPVVVQGTTFELYVEKNDAEQEAEIHESALAGVRFMATTDGREQLETIPSDAEGAE